MKNCAYLAGRGQDVICTLKREALGDIIGFNGKSCEDCMLRQFLLDLLEKYERVDSVTRHKDMYIIVCSNDLDGTALCDYDIWVQEGDELILLDGESL